MSFLLQAAITERRSLTGCGRRHLNAVENPSCAGECNEDDSERWKELKGQHGGEMGEREKQRVATTEREGETHT